MARKVKDGREVTLFGSATPRIRFDGVMWPIRTLVISYLSSAS